MSKLANNYIRSDADRWVKRGECLWCKHYPLLVLNALIVINQSLAYLFWLRHLQHSKNPLLYYFAKYMYRKIGKKNCLQINPKAKIGKGFYLFHGIGIVINGSTIIGEDVSISQFTTIGSLLGKAAEIGNNVYIGPGVSIVEHVIIGNNVKIGSGTVVVKDIPDNSTSVGNPNRIINRIINKGIITN